MSSYFTTNIPLKFEIEDGVEDCKIITIKCTDADAKENKEYCPVFGDNSPGEVLINAYSTIQALYTRYDHRKPDYGF